MLNIQQIDLKSVKKLGGRGAVWGLMAWVLIQISFLVSVFQGHERIFSSGEEIWILAWLLMQTHLFTWVTSGKWVISGIWVFREGIQYNNIEIESVLELFAMLMMLGSLVLLLLALRELSYKTKRSAIFKDFFISVISLVVGGFLLSTLRIPTLLPVVIKFEWGVFILCWIVPIISASFLRRSFDAVAEVTSENTFSLAGKLIFWGTVLVLVLGIGAVASFIGEIVAAVAFFSLQDTLEVQTSC